MFNIKDIPLDVPVLIAGPTASGKSSLANTIADAQGRAIVNADALQVYGCWRVLSARPSLADESRWRHHLYGHVACTTRYSVGAWLRDVAPFVTPQAGRAAPVIVGGTGLYFTALTEGLADIPEIPAALHLQSEAMLASGGLAQLLDEVMREDPATAGRIDTNNPKRVQRAWEVLRATGRGLSSWQAETPAPLVPLAQAVPLVLSPDKTWLSDRIETRFRRMIAEGALEECRQNLETWDPALPASQAIGAADLMASLRGEISLADAIERAIVATRQYAKRQRSWFRGRMKTWTWLDHPQA